MANENSDLDEILDQDVNTELDASTGSNEKDVKNTGDASASDQADEKLSDSSTDDGDKNKEPQTLDEMIEKSIDEVTKAQSKDSPSKGESDQDDERGESPDVNESEKQDASDKDEASKDEESEEEESASEDWRNNPATKRVLAERKKARAERDEFKAQAEQFQHEAQQFQKIQNYLKDGNVSDQDAAMALQLARLWNENPQAMYQQLDRMRTELGTQLGIILPQDLQQKVDEGTITPEDAAALAQAKGNVQITQQQMQRLAEQNQQQAQQAETAYRQQLFNNWMAQASNTDPDIQKKVPLIAAKMSQYLVKEGDPGSVEAAWKRLDRAHEEVNKELKSFTPPKLPTKPAPRSTGTKVSKAAPPSTYEEAMDAAIDTAVSGRG